MIARILKWLDARDAERREDRAALMAAVGAMTAMTQKAFEAQAAQAATFQRFLDTYQIAEPPQIRHWDEVADDERFLQARADGAPDLAALLDKFSKFDAGS